jgi:hypothetical protein
MVSLYYTRKGAWGSLSITAAIFLPKLEKQRRLNNVILRVLSISKCSTKHGVEQTSVAELTHLLAVIMGCIIVADNRAPPKEILL